MRTANRPPTHQTPTAAHRRRAPLPASTAGAPRPRLRAASGWVALDDQQVGDAPNAVTSRSLRIVVNVDLHDFETPGVLARKILDNRRNRAAWSAPRRPEIDQNRSGRFQHFLVEARVGNMNDFVAGHRNFSPAALGCSLNIRTVGCPVKAGKERSLDSGEQRELIVRAVIFTFRFSLFTFHLIRAANPLP